MLWSYVLWCSECVCVWQRKREGECWRREFRWQCWRRVLLAWKGPACDHDVIRSIQWDRPRRLLYCARPRGHHYQLEVSRDLSTGQTHRKWSRTHTQAQAYAYLHVYRHSRAILCSDTQASIRHTMQTASYSRPLTADGHFYCQTRWIPQCLSGHLYGQMCLINEHTQMDRTHTHTHTHTQTYK